jgi:transposase
MKIPKPAFTPEFRDLAVKRVKAGETTGAVAKELGLVEQTLRNWVKAGRRKAS